MVTQGEPQTMRSEWRQEDAISGDHNRPIRPAERPNSFQLKIFICRVDSETLLQRLSSFLKCLLATRQSFSHIDSKVQTSQIGQCAVLCGPATSWKEIICQPVHYLIQMLLSGDRFLQLSVSESQITKITLPIYSSGIALQDLQRLVRHYLMSDHTMGSHLPNVSFSVRNKLDNNQKNWQCSGFSVNAFCRLGWVYCYTMFYAYYLSASESLRV